MKQNETSLMMTAAKLLTGKCHHLIFPLTCLFTQHQELKLKLYTAVTSNHLGYSFSPEAIMVEWNFFLFVCLLNILTECQFPKNSKHETTQIFFKKYMIIFHRTKLTVRTSKMVLLHKSKY